MFCKIAYKESRQSNAYTKHETFRSLPTPRFRNEGHDNGNIAAENEAAKNMRVFFENAVVKLLKNNPGSKNRHYQNRNRKTLHDICKIR